MSDDYHIPVMVSEVGDFLDIREKGIYVDCTLGGGGHSLEILKRGGRVIGIDRDGDAVGHAAERLGRFGDRVRTVASRFSSLVEIVGGDAGHIDGIIMDLGVSSRMIDDSSRGFSYRHDGPLLMTMERSAEETAYGIVNEKSERELAAIFREYGEERRAGRIARAIVEARSHAPVETTSQLADIIEKTVGGRFPQKSKSRIFQAIRMHVNDETGELGAGLEGALDVLGPGGRLCIISYHSIEDRTVKRFMKENENPCICPPDLPVCRCGRHPRLKVLTRKPVTPSDAERKRNPRSRSALLRVAEKIGP
ncbi:MAG: 16S rRNA (cytosine(1402)-N(4))-methyltransferase RsmH [Candidatus Latescibacteria bacterium]|nr:16S rRNA (cytosine(1402)-N(4))-methyltransferase RsmH [Candidatus Latescibacterota bacterium]